MTNRPCSLWSNNKSVFPKGIFCRFNPNFAAFDELLLCFQSFINYHPQCSGLVLAAKRTPLLCPIISPTALIIIFKGRMLSIRSKSALLEQRWNFEQEIGNLLSKIFSGFLKRICTLFVQGLPDIVMLNTKTGLFRTSLFTL